MRNGISLYRRPRPYDGNRCDPGRDRGYKPNNGGNGSNASTYGLTENGTWAVNYGTGKGVIKGKSQCSTRSATDPWVGSGGAYVLQSDSTTTTLPDSSGQYCYCQLTEYTPDGGSAQSLSAPWVFNLDSGGSCASSCANLCASGLRSANSSNLAFRAAVFGTMQSTPASCDATQYTVSYSCGDGTGTAPVNATATYDSSFSPAANTCTRTGYTFAGWAVSSTNDVKPAGTGFTWNYTENKTLTATWTANSYTCAAGEYLRASDATCQPCLANSYCPTATTYTYNGSDQGLTACASPYTNSDAGSDSANDCYRSCTAADVNHLVNGGSVTGRYYSNNTNECEPANDQQCTTGYHYTAGNPDLTTVIGVSQAGTGYGYKPNNGGNGSNASTYGLTENGTWAVNYGTGKGVIKGKSQCSTRSAADPWVGSGGAYVLQSDSTTTTLPDSTGQYCYCQLMEYTPDGGSAQSLSAPWVFNLDSGGSCASSCANLCASGLRSANSSNLAFRAAVFGSLGASVASCDANTYRVVYNSNKPASASGSITGSTATSTHTYDTAKALTTNGYSLTGYTFGGWATTDSGTATYTNGESVTNLTTTNNGTVNLYGVWTPNTYTVTFNANNATSGTPSAASVTCTYDQNCPAFATQGTMVKTNSVFGGWNTANDGSGTNYDAGASNVQNLSSTNGATVPLYAKWTTCTACSAGTGANCALSVTNNACTYTTTCQAGYYNLTNSGAYNPSCSTCGAGTYSTADNTAASCTNVAGGYWNDGCGTDAAGGVCNNTYHGGAINAGYFSTGGGQSATPSGSNCTSGNTCGQCTTDSTTNRPAYSDAGASSCSPCPIGYTYNTTAGKSAITQCQANCPAGQWNGDYTMVEYLQNDGNAYIDTGYIPQGKPSVKTKIYATSGSGTQMWGTRWTPAPTYDTLGAIAGSAGNLTVYYGLYENQEYSVFPGYQAGVVHTLELAEDHITYDGVITSITRNTLSGTTPYPLVVGGFNNVGTIAGTGVSRIYPFEVHENGTSVLNLVPARRNSDNVLGLYDTVSGNFFTNAGTGTFTAGPDVGGIGQCANVAAGYYSAGGVVTFGTTGTRTQCPTEYPNSVSGASANTQCYTACTTANIAHSTTVSGNDYYGAGTDTCVASACVTGYTPASGGATCGANTITIRWGDGDDNSANDPTTQCTYDGAISTPATAPTKRGHMFNGWTFSTLIP